MPQYLPNIWRLQQYKPIQQRLINFIYKQMQNKIKENIDFDNKRLSRNKQQSYKSAALLEKQIKLLTEAVRVRDQEIIKLKGIIQAQKIERKYRKTALTTQSQYDPLQKLDQSFFQLPMTWSIQQYREQLEELKKKFQDSSEKIYELQAKLKSSYLNANSTEQALKSEIQLLREDLKYLKEQHERRTDCLKIQFEQISSQRIKIVQRKYKQQIQILNEDIKIFKQDIATKNLDIMRLTDKLKKQRQTSSSNVRFVEDQNSSIRKHTDEAVASLKQQMRKREQNLILQFQKDLEELHNEQAAEIVTLCDRIRLLKALLQQKQSQIQSLWKIRSKQVQKIYSNNQNIQINNVQTFQNSHFSMIQKYMKN